jgi:hypothetical protein
VTSSSGAWAADPVRIVSPARAVAGGGPASPGLANKTMRIGADDEDANHRRAAVSGIAFGVAGAPAAAQSSAFSGKAAVRSVDVKCLTAGGNRGRVVVEVKARYPDASTAGARRLANGSHRVRSWVRLLSPRGGRFASDLDLGTAQVDIPQLRAYTHVHQHLLRRAASRRVLGGRPCGRGARTSVRVRVRVTQVLSGTRQASGAVTRLAPGAATASQSASMVVSAPVTAAASVADVVNGCQLVGQDTNCHGADLSGQYLFEQSLPYSDFSFANLSNANLALCHCGHVIMNQTVLDGADMTGAELGGAALTTASLQGTTLTGAKLPFANLAYADLSGAHLEGVNLGAANLANTMFGNTSCDATTVFPTAFGQHCSNGRVSG